jgi:uncharacterized membrane protein
MTNTVAELGKRWLKRRPDKLTEIESRVLQSAIDRRAVSKDTNLAHASSLTTGDRIADSLARVGGSWTFILAFIAFLMLWTTTNVWLLKQAPFDPYPFIFLNLILSMIAALQAPVIMMSQNRQAQRDRLDALHDYEVNLKAEIEIMALHEKLDELRHSQIIGMRGDITQIATQLKRIEQQLSPGENSSL